MRDTDRRFDKRASAGAERPRLWTNRLLDRLGAEDVARLKPHLKQVELRRGDVLHEAHGAIERVYFPLAGMVSLVVATKSGETIETAVVGRDGVVGASVASDFWHSFSRAVVQIPGSAWQLGAGEFARACRASQPLTALMTRYQAVILLQAQQNSACHALHSVEARLARWMLQAQDLLGTSTIDLTQEFLSHMLGVQRTSVSLCAHALQKEGLIDYSRGRITILDRSGLASHACECHAVIRSESEKALSAPAPARE
jgi:CRP-like cAMP-binding protein